MLVARRVDVTRGGQTCSVGSYLPQYDSRYVNRIALLDKMIATVGTSSKADLVERFERLLANAREQMLSEDDLMMSLNYPEYDEHYNDHYTLYTTILGLRLKAALGFCSVKDLKRVRELCVGHISRHDHRLETYLGAGQHSC